MKVDLVHYRKGQNIGTVDMKGPPRVDQWISHNDLQYEVVDCQWISGAGVDVGVAYVRPIQNP